MDVVALLRASSILYGARLLAERDAVFIAYMHTRNEPGSLSWCWRDGRFRLSEAGIRSIVAAVEAHRDPAAASTLWIAVAVLVVGALAALSFIRRSEESHSHLK